MNRFELIATITTVTVLSLGWQTRADGLRTSATDARTEVSTPCGATWLGLCWNKATWKAPYTPNEPRTPRVRELPPVRVQITGGKPPLAFAYAEEGDVIYTITPTGATGKYIRTATGFRYEAD